MSEGPWYLEEGDHVFIGQASPRKVHWTIASFEGDGTASLESGMTGRRTTATVDSLTLHSKGQRP